MAQFRLVVTQTIVATGVQSVKKFRVTSALPSNALNRLVTQKPEYNVLGTRLEITIFEEPDEDIT